MLYRDQPNDYIVTVPSDDNISVKTNEESLHHSEYLGSIHSLSVAHSDQTQELFSKEDLHEEVAAIRRDKLVKGDDSGCVTGFPVGLPRAKLDHTGSSGYGSSYAPDSVTYSAINYHKNLIADLPDEGEPQQQLGVPDRKSELSSCISLTEKSPSFNQAGIVLTDSHQTVIRLPIEGDSFLRACSSSPETVPYSPSPHMARYCINCKHSGDVTTKRCAQGNSLNSVGEDHLSQASEGSEYMNCLNNGHNNCVYTDEKGYIRFKVTSV